MYRSTFILVLIRMECEAVDWVYTISISLHQVALGYQSQNVFFWLSDDNKMIGSTLLHSIPHLHALLLRTLTYFGKYSQ